MCDLLVQEAEFISVNTLFPLLQSWGRGCHCGEQVSHVYHTLHSSGHQCCPCCTDRETEAPVHRSSLTQGSRGGRAPSGALLPTLSHGCGEQCRVSHPAWQRPHPLHGNPDTQPPSLTFRLWKTMLPKRETKPRRRRRERVSWRSGWPSRRRYTAVAGVGEPAQSPCWKGCTLL